MKKNKKHLTIPESAKTLSKKRKKEIDRAVKKVVEEYGKVLRLLGRE